MIVEMRNEPGLRAASFCFLAGLGPLLALTLRISRTSVDAILEDSMFEEVTLVKTIRVW